jgi:predicted peroxiredoxin
MSNKVVINLATGLEDPERVMIAFLVGGAATARGKQVAMFLTKDGGLDDTEFVANARVAGATPLWEWIGDEAATVFSY